MKFKTTEHLDLTVCTVTLKRSFRLAVLDKIFDSFCQALQACAEMVPYINTVFFAILQGRINNIRNQINACKRHSVTKRDCVIFWFIQSSGH
jgi:hypothetical protein